MTWPETLGCPRCDADELSLKEARGRLEVFRCPTCGFETWRTVSYAEDLPPVAEDVSLVVRWKEGNATAAEIHALRDSFPDFRDVSFSELLATVGKKSSLRIGIFPRPYAEELGSRARSRGLAVEFWTQQIGGSPAKRLESYEPMWTTEKDRYGLLEVDPGVPGSYLVFDLAVQTPMIIDGDHELASAVIENMRRAGVRIITREEGRLPPGGSRSRRARRR